MFAFLIYPHRSSQSRPTTHGSRRWRSRKDFSRRHALALRCSVFVLRRYYSIIDQQVQCRVRRLPGKQRRRGVCWAGVRRTLIAPLPIYIGSDNQTIKVTRLLVYKQLKKQWADKLVIDVLKTFFCCQQKCSFSTKELLLFWNSNMISIELVLLGLLFPFWLCKACKFNTTEIPGMFYEEHCDLILKRRGVCGWIFSSFVSCSFQLGALLPSQKMMIVWKQVFK